MTTPESRTVELVCPACHHKDHDPGSCPQCPYCELHTDEALAFVLRVEPELVLAAAKEHGLVIGEGELDGLRELSDAATAGPWEWVEPHSIIHRIDAASVNALIPVAAIEGLFSKRHANGALIVAAVNYVRERLRR